MRERPPAGAIILLSLTTAATHALAGAWQPWGPSSAPSNPRIGIAAHPRTPGHLLAARELTSLGDGFTTHYSADGGADWTCASEVAGSSNAGTVPKVLLAGEWAYAANDARLARSQDGAVSWTPLDAGSNQPQCVIGANPDLGTEVVTCSIGIAGIRHSLDAGTTWTTIASPQDVRGGSIDWTTRTVFVIPGFGGPLLSKPLDSGTVWIPGPVAQDVAAAGGKALAARGGVLSYSNDHGVSWQGVTIGGADFAAIAVAYAPTRPEIAYALEAAPASRMAKSVDGGATFTIAGAIAGDGGGNAEIAVEAGAGDRVIVSVEGRVLRSIDSGATWQPLPRAGDFPSRSSRGVSFDAAATGLRFVRGDVASQRSIDAGLTWQPVQDLVIGTSPSRSGLVFGVRAFGVTFGSVLSRSVDSGVTFQETPLSFNRNQSEFRLVAGEAPSEFFVFVRTSSQVPPAQALAYRSTDEGVTWTAVTGLAREVLSVARSSGAGLALYAGVDAPIGEAGLFRSLNHGTSWQAIVTGDVSGPVTAIAVDPANPQRLFVAYRLANGAEVLRSVDGGATWTSVWSALPTTDVTALIVDPSNSLRIFAGTSTQGVFTSVDGGASWSALDQGLTDHRVNALDFDPRDPTKLYASTKTGPYLADLSTGTPTGNRWAVEYYHARFDHYFVSADADEIAGLDAGAFEGWARTGESFRVGPAPSSDQAPVCRFFGVGFAPLSSHFYTPYPDECAFVKTDPKWFYEKIAFGLRLPESNKGCLPGHAPLFRTWNRNRDGAPAHRYTSNHQTFLTMVGLGWEMEGEATTFVFACVPR